MMRIKKKTELQRMAAGSHFLRKLFIPYLTEDEGLPLFIAMMISSMIWQAIADGPEPYIKRCLIELLYCSDITDEQRDEIVLLLRTGETALTNVQRRTLEKISPAADCADEE